jgi:phosphoribosylformylglycinamidine cyclo-ligase
VNAPSSYRYAGVRGQDAALESVARHLGPTLANAEVLAGFGGYAAVLRLSEELAVAVCSDGVGSKTMVAAALNRYDTLGFDLVAMCCNDLLCVGARPVAMVDYLGVNTLEEERVDALLRGLGAAALEAGIAVPGGEIAQLPEIIGREDTTAFDLVGAAFGTVPPDAVLDGDAVSPGDSLVGIDSTGIHANGLTLARRVLLEGAGLRLEERVEALGGRLGDELLVPTAIYVRPILALWDAGVEVRGLAHITGGGLLNLCRLRADVGFALDGLPDPSPIFELIAEAGGVARAEMYTVFNMGVGLVAVVADSDVDATTEIVRAHGRGARRIGRVTDEAGVVRVEPAGPVLTAE